MFVYDNSLLWLVRAERKSIFPRMKILFSLFTTSSLQEIPSLLPCDGHAIYSDAIWERLWMSLEDWNIFHVCSLSMSSYFHEINLFSIFLVHVALFMRSIFLQSSLYMLLFSWDLFRIFLVHVAHFMRSIFFQLPRTCGALIHIFCKHKRQSCKGNFLHVCYRW